MQLHPGDKAPLFNMFDSDRQPVSLESFRGHNVVLHFYPAAFTSTCTKQLCTVRDDLSFYNDLDAKVIGISTDSLYVLKKYKEEQNLNFTLASDYNKEVCGMYGAQYELFNYGMKGTAKRAAFVIDKKGIIQYAEVLDNASGLPDFDLIKETLKKLDA
ncbi:MAG TPA: peroxiredoxin [Bacteroidia bacterium]|nr:peroxiredoxin [Bacteroidia bacterium]